MVLICLCGQEPIGFFSPVKPAFSIPNTSHDGLLQNKNMEENPVEYPIDGTLDLHAFRPDEVKDLVQDYLAECRARGILRVRIIHGKGIGTLREMVHALLSKMPDVESFRLAGEDGGGWGATIVVLKPG
jgi:DNA-nicking Smr family endonuclease